MSDIRKAIMARLGEFARPGAKAEMAYGVPNAFPKFNKGDMVADSVHPNRKGKIVQVIPGRYDAKSYTTAENEYIVDFQPTAGLVRYGEKRLVRASRPGAKAAFGKPQFRVRKLYNGYLAVDVNQGSGWERYDTTHEDSWDGLDDYERGYEKAYSRGLRWSGGAWRIPSSKSSRPGAKATAAKPDETEREDVKAGLKLMEKADQAVSDKIRTLIKEGKPQDQAVTIALDMKRRGEL